MRALVTGGGGQLGTGLRLGTPAGVEAIVLASRELDIRDGDAVRAAVARIRPDVIVNAAAYTAVDRAESEPELAFAANRDGPGHLAAAAAECGAFLVHVSTDFVFAGDAGRPYRPDDPTGPLSAYGESKLAGERAVRAGHPDAAIVRSAWVHAPGGHNFVRTMLRLMRERGAVRVVEDQVGTPTSAASLAAACWRLAELRASGTWHWTDAGVASWFDFAVAIAEESVSLGLLPSMPELTPIRTEDFPTPARRPSYGVLDKTSTRARTGLVSLPWRIRLRETLAEIRNGNLP